MLRKIIKITVPLALAGVLFWYFYKDLDFNQLKEDLKNANYWMVLAAFLPTLISHFSRARRWQLMIQSAGEDIGFWQTFVAVMGGYFANYLLPRMGEVTRCGMLFQSSRVPIQKSLGTVFAERALDLIALLLITAMAFGMEFELLSNFFSDIISQKTSTSTAHSTSVIKYMIYAFILLAPFVLWIIYRWRHIPMFGKIWAFIEGLFRAMFSILKVKNNVEFLSHTILIWFGYFLSTYLGFFMLEATQFLDLKAALMIFVVGSYGMVAPVQGGIGAFHFMVSSGLMLYNIGYQTAYTVALLMHTSQTIFNMAIGGLCFAANFYFSTKQTAHDIR